MDLDIKAKGYESEKVVGLFAYINEQKANHGYVSPKLPYVPMAEDFKGFFANGPDALSEMVNAELSLIDAFLSMEELVNQTYLYTDEKKT
jgi:hypothetical protein